jgi:AraC-like DNA-binding protein
MDTVAFQLIDRWEAEAHKQGDIDQQCLAKYKKAVSFYNGNMPERNISVAPAYLEFFRNNGKDGSISYYRIYYFLIHALLIRGDVETATVQVQEMYKQAETQNNKVGKGVALHAMTLVYSAQGRTDKGVETLREAIDLFESAEQSIESTARPALYSLQETAYIYLCYLLLEQQAEVTPAMIRKYEALLSRSEAANNRKAPRVNLWNMYLLYYLQTEEYDKAEMYCDTIENTLATGYSYLDAIVYRLKICVGRGEYDKALELSDKALAIADSSDVSWLNEIRRQKMKILAKTGQSEELLNLALHTISANDSLYHKDLAYQVDELRTKYELNEHIREKEYMRKYIYITSLVCLLLMITLLIWTRYSHLVNRKNRDLVRQIREQDFLRAELERKREQERELNTRIKNPDGDGDSDTEKEDIFDRTDRLIKEQRIFADSHISRKSVAEMIGINERTLYDCIKNSTGMNFSDYITFLRLNYARELLAGCNEKLTMEVIADEAGFGSRASFYRLFKDSYGLSPDEFRKLTRKQPA